MGEYQESRDQDPFPAQPEIGEGIFEQYKVHNDQIADQPDVIDESAGKLVAGKMIEITEKPQRQVSCADPYIKPEPFPAD